MVSRDCRTKTKKVTKKATGGIPRRFRFRFGVLVFFWAVIGWVTLQERTPAHSEPMIDRMANRFGAMIQGPVLLGKIRRGSLHPCVMERGELECAVAARITCPIPGGAKIVDLVPQGTRVMKDDLIVELDSSDLAVKQAQQEIAIAQLQQLKLNQERDLEVQRSQNADDLESVRLKLKLAEIDRAKFTQGDFPQQKNELQSTVSQLQTEVAQQQEALAAFLTPAKADENPSGEPQLISDQLSRKKIELEAKKSNLTIAIDKLRVLHDFTYERVLAELEGQVAKSLRELTVIELKGQAALSQKQSDLLISTQSLQRAQDVHARLKRHLADCKIYAPQDGQVVYARYRDQRSNAVERIHVGSLVPERQPIFILPDMKDFWVEIRVPQSYISQIRDGTRVKAQLDDFPGTSFPAQVESVISPPIMPGSGGKEFAARIRLDLQSVKVHSLRPGMMATIEIALNVQDDVLQAPIESVIPFVGKEFVYVVRDNQVERLEVTTGVNNSRFVEIKSGLMSDDVVIMNPRALFHQELNDQESVRRWDQTSMRLLSSTTSLRPSAPSIAPSTEADRRPEGGLNPMVFFDRMDANRNGQLESGEWSERFRERAKTLDKNNDDVITREEFQSGFSRPPVN